ncbi:MAG TPA: hypothetical protein PKY87_09235 [Terricaulis sp.]|nr:hypothetical protein [Terricaulis sp.]
MKKHEQVGDPTGIVELGKATEETQGTPLDDAVEGIDTRDFYDPQS